MNNSRLSNAFANPIPAIQSVFSTEALHHSSCYPLPSHNRNTNQLAIDPRSTKRRRCRLSTPNSITSLYSERVLGVDYGHKRIGLAVSVGIQPRPLRMITTLRTQTMDDLAKQVKSAAISSLCEVIVVGLPVHIDFGSEHGIQVNKTKHFIDALVKCTPWATIYSLDERLTTVLAKERMQSFKNCDVDLDSMAAVILLERYFNTDDSKPNLIHQSDGSGNGLSVEKNANFNRVGFEDWKKKVKQNALNCEQELSSNGEGDGSEIGTDNLINKNKRRKKKKRR